MKYFLLLLNFELAFGQSYLHYTCKSYFDYTINRNFNPNCSYNPNLYASFVQIANNYGYAAQTYTVTTQDKYILTMFRIPYGKYGKRSNYNGIPVFLQHGLFSSSNGYVLLGNRSLAFLLADQGYDVWLGNFRGVRYSLGNKRLSTGDPKFWNFTMHENGIYDLTSQIEFVYNKTRQKVIYVGYSIGTTSFYIYNILRQDKANQQVKFAISLAPLVYIVYSQLQTEDLIPLFPLHLIINVLGSYTNGTFFMRTPLTLNLAMRALFDTPLQTMLTYYSKALATGVGFPQEEPPNLPISVDQAIEAVALKTIYYLIQMTLNNQFFYYDYGKQANVAYYGTKEPPIYNLSKLTVPNYLIYSPGDFLATQKNVERIYMEMPKRGKLFGPPYKIKNTHFSHTDFISTPRAYDLVYDQVLKFIKAHKNMA